MKNEEKIVLSLASLSVEELIAFANAIAGNLKNNSSFPDPSPGADELQTAANLLQNTYQAAIDGGKMKTAVRNDARNALTKQLEQLVHYVEWKAAGNVEAIHALGFKTKKPKGALSKGEYWVEQGKESGSVILKTAAIKSRAIYFWECSTDSGQNWSALHESASSKTIAKGLKPGTRYMFRSYYIDTDGRHAPGEPLSLMVV